MLATRLFAESTRCTSAESRRTSSPSRGSAAAVVLAALAVPTRAMVQLPRVTCEDVTLSGQVSNHSSFTVGLSRDGRWILFTSNASNLVPGDTNDVQDLFLRDRHTGVTTRENLRADGSQVPSTPLFSEYLPADGGRFVAFGTSLTMQLPGDVSSSTLDIFVRDRVTGQLTRESNTLTGISAGGYHVRALSADGRFLVFTSSSSLIVPGDSNGLFDTFLRDRSTGAFTCLTTNLADVPSGGEGWISDDRRYCAWVSTASGVASGAANGLLQLYWRDLQTGERRCISKNSSGVYADRNVFEHAFSGDGRRAVFVSSANNLFPGDSFNSPDLFFYDADTDVLTRVLLGPLQQPGAASRIALNFDGRQLAFFGSDALLPPLSVWGELYVAQLPGGALERRCPSVGGGEINADIGLRIAMSADASVVAFESVATNAAAGGFTGQPHVYTSDMTPQPRVYCTSKTNSLGCVPVVSATGLLRLSEGLPYPIRATQLLNGRPGLWAYSLTGAAATPFQGGLLCIAPPIARGPVLNAGGALPPSLDCSGAVEFDFADFVRSGHDPALTPGRLVWATYWSRDPGYNFPDNTNLTAGLEFGVFP